jgi:ubiquinone/menaquinone biosynthesis C-methylase UbiE
MALPHWEDYWKTGWVVSCPTGSLDGYTGQVKTTWEQFFAALHDGSRVLDVGTGNGALPLIALECARRHSVTLQVHGVDVARIDPCHQVPDGHSLFRGVAFHGGVAAEAMPFASGHFHAACGQFALEYTRHEAALREIHRVMVPDAPARFVLHHASSVVVRNARESLQHARALEHDAGAFADLREYVAAERVDAARAAQLHARMTERMQHLHRLAAQAQGSRLLAGVLPALAQLFELRQELSAHDFATAFEAAQSAFNAAVRRLNDLVDAALDETAMASLADQARASGFHEVRFEPLLQDAHLLVGWGLDMRSAAVPGKAGSGP